MIDWDTQSPLTAITHLDGRNASKLVALRPYFSEFAWMRMRLRVMTQYALSLAISLGDKPLTSSQKQECIALHERFSLDDAQEVTAIERTVNHDLKALELFLISRLKRSHLSRLIPYINLGIGSEDINSMALGLLLSGSRGTVLVPALKKIVKILMDRAYEHRGTVMIGRTHAQPANVTTFGKEMATTLSRLCDEMSMVQSLNFEAKCSGEVGSYQAFMGLDRSFDAKNFTDRFVRSLGLDPCPVSTQIASYDSIIRYLQTIARINAILLDFVKNMWLYVLLGYVRIKKIEAEVGSAGMPHKVNPIYFEGAEGGLEMANGVIELFARKLPVNRLQRDFSDSTLRRNLVLPIAYSLLSYQSIVEGMNRIDVNTGEMTADLDRHPEVWTETIKTYGIAHGVSDMYDRLKIATRGRNVTQEDIERFIEALPLTRQEKQEAQALRGGKNNPYPARMVSEVVKRARKVIKI